MPFLQDLHVVLGHHVQLGVLDGDEVLFLERLSAPGECSTTPGSPGGCRRMRPGPGWCCSPTARASGWSASWPDAWSGSPRTPTDPDRIRGLLADIRR